jgi:hypothetical protein
MTTTIDKIAWIHLEDGKILSTHLLHRRPPGNTGDHRRADRP